MKPTLALVSLLVVLLFTSLAEAERQSFGLNPGNMTEVMYKVVSATDITPVEKTWNLNKGVSDGYLAVGWEDSQLEMGWDNQYAYEYWLSYSFDITTWPEQITKVVLEIKTFAPARQDFSKYAAISSPCQLSFYPVKAGYQGRWSDGLDIIKAASINFISSEEEWKKSIRIENKTSIACLIKIDLTDTYLAARDTGDEHLSFILSPGQKGKLSWRSQQGTHYTGYSPYVRICGLNWPDPKDRPTLWIETKPARPIRMAATVPSTTIPTATQLQTQKTQSRFWHEVEELKFGGYILDTERIRASLRFLPFLLALGIVLPLGAFAYSRWTHHHG